MPSYLFTAARCKNCEKITLLPSSIPPEKSVRRETMRAGDIYLNFACPHCSCVFHYQTTELESQLHESREPHELDPGKTLVGVWLECEEVTCDSHVHVQTMVASNTSKADLRSIAEGWLLSGIKCYRGHHAKLPINLEWESLHDREYSAGWTEPLCLRADAPQKRS